MSTNLFNSIPVKRPKKNFFDLSHDVKMSANFGKLYPTLALECIPGDTFQLSCETLIRCLPMVAPVLHRWDITAHYWFVPNRILWPNWEKFITNTPDAVTGLVPAFPTFKYKLEDTDPLVWKYNKLMDYMGLPTPPATAFPETVSAMPFAAYAKIWQDYYRDQNLQFPVESSTDQVWKPLNDGDNPPGTGALNILFDQGANCLPRAWEHDRFTSALPFAQKGAAVDIPLGDVKLKEDWSSFTDNIVGPHFVYPDGTTVGIGDVGQGSVPATTWATGIRVPNSGATDASAYNPMGTLETEAATINDLRRAFKLQEWLEANARGGSRYAEHIKNMFGEDPGDARLQRAEYITGLKTAIQISEVLQTSESATTPQANMAGHGIGVQSGSKYGKYHCKEHGYIMCLLSIQPKTAYQQGIPKHFLKTQDAFQYFYHQFANIGEEAIQNREVYAFQGAAGDETFGYTPRYSDYKNMPSRVAGALRTSLDFWHTGRIFAAPPALNDDFIKCNPDYRNFAVEDENEDHFVIHQLHKIGAVRGMPKYGVPTI